MGRIVRSLTWKLVASYVGVIALALLIVSLWVGISVGQRFEQFVETTLTRQAESLSGRIAQRYTAGFRDWQSDASLVVTSANLTRSDIWVADESGRIQLAVNPEGAPQGEQPSPDDLAPALQGNVVHGSRGLPIVGTRQIYAAVPIRSDGRVVGAVYFVESSTQPLRRRPVDEFLPGVNARIIGGGVAAGILAAVIGAALAQTITRPLREITRAVEQVARGDYEQRVSVRSRDEVGQLAAACNQMALQLEHDVGELRRQEQLRRDLVANVSHDLSTPLTSIQGFTEALLDGVVKGEEQQRETYRTMYAEVLRLHRLVDDLKNLNQLESGAVRILPRPLDLRPLIQETLRVEGAEAELRGIALVDDLPENLPLVSADGDRIGQVLLNLLDNALRYTPSGGTISVSADAQGAFVWVEVRDTGEGIPESSLPYIFERFYRVDPSRSTHTGGGGLGLAIVKAIVEAHGGQVTASSEVGKGTALRFSLPRAGVPAEPQADRERARVPVA